MRARCAPSKGVFDVQTDQPGRIDIHVSGLITAPLMARGLEAFEVAVQRLLREGDLVCRIKGWPLATPGAQAVKIERAAHLLATLKRINRVAVVADHPVVRVGTHFQSRVFRGTALRAFSNLDDAERWIADPAR